jgi:WD40 repeat protein
MRGDDAWKGFTSRMGSVRVDIRATIRTGGAIVAFAVAGLLMCAWPSPGYGRVYSIKHPFLVLKSHQRSVVALAFSTDGRQPALAGDYGSVEIWDVRAAHRLRTLKGSSQVFTVAFSPSGRQLATSSADSKINVWQLQGDELLSSFEVPGGPAYSIGYTPDGNRIAAGCKDGVIRLYSTGGQLLHAFGDIVSGISVIDSAAGVRIAGLEGQGVRMWDAQTGELVQARPLDMLPWLSLHVQHMGLVQHMELTKIPSFQLSPPADFVAVAGDPAPGSRLGEST